MEYHLIAAIAVILPLIIFIGAPMLVGKILDWLLQWLTRGKYGASAWRTFLWTWVVLADIIILTGICTGYHFAPLRHGRGSVIVFGVLLLAPFALFPITRKKP